MEAGRIQCIAFLTQATEGTVLPLDDICYCCEDDVTVGMTSPVVRGYPIRVLPGNRQRTINFTMLLKASVPEPHVLISFFGYLST
jgi:hypothetical protein